MSMKYMIIIFLLFPALCFAQNQKTGKYEDATYGSAKKDDGSPKMEPFKGAHKIISTYDINGDTLFMEIARDLIGAGYEIEKRDKELLFITTADRPVKQINYTLKMVVKDNQVITTGLYKSTIGLQIGYVKTEPGVEILKYTGRAYVTRNAFDEIIKFIESTNPTAIEYSK